MYITDNTFLQLTILCILDNKCQLNTILKYKTTFIKLSKYIICSIIVNFVSKQVINKRLIQVFFLKAFLQSVHKHCYLVFIGQKF